MNRRHFVAGAAGAAWLAGAGYTLFGRSGGKQLLNVSYDATRELYRHINAIFAEHQLQTTGTAVRVRPSHGGSGGQARAVIDGMPADVVTLALWQDTDKLREAALIDAGWEDRFEERSCPYTSTIVFAVRKGNPHEVHDWPDLVSKPVSLVTANPKTSGAAKLGLIAAYGSVTSAGGSAAEAEAFVRAVYRKVPALESSSRAASVSFVRKRMGDVQVTWESEAWQEKRELGDEMEIVYPTRSVLAEPHVAVVDRVAERNGNAELARAYLDFLYKPAAQQVIAEQAFRPARPDGVPAEQLARLQTIPHLRRVGELIPGGWPVAQRQFFADGGLFDRVYTSR
jgi:sulfate/thiosulfate transport system substrate-binding protein